MTAHLTSPDRVSHAQKAAAGAGVDALLVTPGPDLRWLTGYDALPHLCAGRRAFRPACLSGAPAAGERRQLLLRPPDHRRRCPAGGHRPRSVRDGRDAGPGRQSGDSRPAEIFGAEPQQFEGFGHHRPAVLAAIDKAEAAFAGPDRWIAAPITRAAGDGRASARSSIRPSLTKCVGTVTRPPPSRSRRRWHRGGGAAGMGETPGRRARRDPQPRRRSL